MKKITVLLIGLLLASAGVHVNAQRIKGSDTVLPIAQQTAERFMQEDPDARVTVTGGGSGVGISALLDKTTDIAMASRSIKFGETMKAKKLGEDLTEAIIAYDALAVVVHPSNPVNQLTREQLEGIFRGKITNWKEVGGEDRKIVVYSPARRRAPSAMWAWRMSPAASRRWPCPTTASTSPNPRWRTPSTSPTPSCAPYTIIIMRRIRPRWPR